MRIKYWIDKTKKSWYHMNAFNHTGGYGNAEERPERPIWGLAGRVILCAKMT